MEEEVVEEVVEEEVVEEVVEEEVVMELEHPPAGVFAAGGDPDTEWRSEIVDSVFRRNEDTSVTVVPGVISVPDFEGHGSAWIYNQEEQAWMELDYSEKAVTGTWSRIEGDHTEGFSKGDPPAGIFAINGEDEDMRCEFAGSGMNWTEYGGDSAEVLAPGVCNVPAWFDHGSLFVYNWADDAWLELDYSTQEVTTVWNRVE